MSQFSFLSTDFQDLKQHAQKAEKLALSDPRGACFWSRLTLETALKWLYRRDPALRHPYERTLAALIAEPSLEALTGPAITTKAKYIKDQGNRAAHDSGKALTAQDAASTVRELFHVCYWIARTYATGPKPDPALSFDIGKLERSLTISASTVAQIQKIEGDVKAANKRAEEAEEARKESEEGRKAVEEELARLRAEYAAARKANQAIQDDHDYGEAATRDAFIDLLLHEAGWALDQPRDREFPVKGMPSQSGEGFADYVLWGADGKPLAVVEAKRTKKDSRTGQQQAKLYADCLEKMYGQRPVIFTTNGYEHWIWDDLRYPPRKISGFLKRDELVLLQQRRGNRKTLDDVTVDEAIAGRFYQQRAIRRIGQAFEKDRQRKGLLVMATGSGKTRTVIALIDQLMRGNWVKRVLFLADRVALVKQAHGAFKTHLPATPSANLLERHDPARNDHSGGRVFLSTYPTMMGLIDEIKGGEKRFGPGHFDLIVIDEAHRSVYRKYRAIFEYFDSFLVGLTATPKDEIDHNTYSLFNLESGVPTDAYDLDDAVQDGYLVPPKSISVPLKFQRDGIAYDQLSDHEKDEWDAIEWDEDGTIPDRVESNDLNKWLFNKDTVDKVLEHVMRNGIKVAGGDQLGKTIIFAKNSKHAQFIIERFDQNYPHLAGQFTRLIDYSVTYAQSLIDDFSEPEKQPHIAVSVDMMDTGIDVPEVVNLVFFKIVRSKTKFWQMVGRGTRLREDLFAPGEDKEDFIIFDFCQNLEFFRENPDARNAGTALPIGERLFKTRVELIGDLQEQESTHADLEKSLKERLFDEVSGMNLENFMVRDKRRAVEQFKKMDRWATLDLDARITLTDEIAGLPSAYQDDHLPAKQFDLLVLNAQLLLLRGDAGFQRLQMRMIKFASALEGLSNVPTVAKQMELILEMQTDQFWTDISVDILEEVRRKLRMLADLIQPKERKVVITDFEDEIGGTETIDLPEVGTGIDKARFKLKVRKFVETHMDHITLQKIYRAEALTRTDVEELQKMLIEQGVSDTETLSALQEEEPLGVFLRRLIGLDRAAAKQAFSAFMSAQQLNPDQTEFIDMIIDHLTDSGIVEPRTFYESPFSDIDNLGIAGVFKKDHAAEIIRIVKSVNDAAVAA
ncbi:DEAD/DEAH box helicase family protein [Marinovum sp. 2_MG-2023]|uniref:DEAD/DEAH box helicase family protein n=1 Tax=unclassified Marinovum TaxID=2647166 RepID=UPI0026E45744|nr:MULTISPECIES: DEAD/DEAH box helicase family protein [unclassified Marinovum]MDO6732907.1 DEAD/DEAH box helicase family protein [Marinovum sp. 2_MG-2023]MDO6782183.1 DEAD/DEAH box helicase family protein [Marinovum sp. 1_MG-2023]